ncbi:MAG: GDSL-type esterase/lipase family protein [Pseudomonadota bacterium]
MIRKRDSSLKIVFFLIFVSTFISFAQESKNVQPIKVACIGDSITFGAGLAARKKDSYPAVLGRVLGNGYKVKNFGVSGRTALRKSKSPYWNLKAFRNAMAFNPDIVIIKLGTNDSKPVNWQYKDEFEKDYGDFVGVFLNLPSHPKVFICHPIPALNKNDTISDSTIVNEIIPIIGKVGKVKKVEVIDLYKAFSGKDKLFLDGVHLNEEGCTFIAKIIYKAITGKEVIDKETVAWKK